MARSCARAVELGLPSIAFTDHCDFTRWRIDPARPARPGSRQDDWLRWERDGWLAPPPLEVTGYLAAVEQCRERFPGLRILSGAELGEPHWYPDQARAVLGAGSFDRVLGSVHSLATGDPAAGDSVQMVDFLYGPLDPAALARSGRALELNTVVPLPAPIVGWWYEAAGQSLAFGSDAHEPGLVAREFARAGELAAAVGFRPGRPPHDLWQRAGMIGGWT